MHEPVIKRPQQPVPPYPYAEEEVLVENKKAGAKICSNPNVSPGWNARSRGLACRGLGGERPG